MTRLAENEMTASRGMPLRVRLREWLGLALPAAELCVAGLHVLCFAKQEPFAARVYTDVVDCDMPELRCRAAAVQLPVALRNFVGPSVVAFCGRRQRNLEYRLVALLRRF